MMTNTEAAVEVLRRLQVTSTPKFVDSGEAIAYEAYKDAALEKAISFLDAAHRDERPLAPYEFHVDHQQLANTVMERVFDHHVELLRSKLAEAEKSAHMWKSIALRGKFEKAEPLHADGDTKTLETSVTTRRSVGTQVEEDEGGGRVPTSPPCGIRANEMTGRVATWLMHGSTELLSSADEKWRLWCAAQHLLMRTVSDPAGTVQGCSSHAKESEALEMNDPTIRVPTDTNASPLMPHKALQRTPNAGGLHNRKTWTSALLRTTERTRRSDLDPHSLVEGSPLYVLKPALLQHRSTQQTVRPRVATSEGKRRQMPHLPDL